jgi:putative sugar O-methyltransferase
MMKLAWMKVRNRLALIKRFLISVYLNGFTNEVIHNPRIKIQNLKKSEYSITSVGNMSNPSSSGTSISDSPMYLEYGSFCELASRHDEVFSHFRSHPAYRGVLEHVPHWLAVKYGRLLKDKELYLQTLDKIDSVGTPWKYRYRFFGEGSPTALRYCYFTELISELFPSLSVSSMCEIGGGFGGQVLALSDKFPLKEVTIVDISPALSLTSRFLNTVRIDFTLHLNAPTQTNEKTFDFLISNYAFSELNRRYQDWYLQNYILKASNGFILWNKLSFTELDGYSLDNLVSIIPGARTMPESPLSFDGNTVIYWRA